MSQAKKNLFNRLSLNQKILTLIFIEIVGFISLMLVSFAQIDTVSSETKKMSSITIPLIESVHSIDESVYKQSLSVNELFITITHIVNQDSDKASFYEKYLQLLESNLIQEAFSMSSQKLKESITDTEAFIRKVRNEEIGDKDIISVNQENLLIELYELRKVAQQYLSLIHI